MGREFRYTGEWPPIEVVERYANWEYALDEEGVEGQDETTIRPESEQAFITENTAFTSAKATQANGTVLPAILCILDGEIESVDVLLSDDTSWRVNNMPSGWEPFDQNWPPEHERMPCVSLEDESIFPLRVISTLPLGRDGITIELEIP